MTRRAPAAALVVCLIGFVPVVIDAVGARSRTNPDPVRTWNELALQTARTKSLSDAQAARLYAMVNVAIYDAVNGIIAQHGHQGRTHALVPPVGASPSGNLFAAASAAAHAVLAGEFPDLRAGFDTQLAADLSDAGAASPADAGRLWGATVGNAVRSARANDGSTPAEAQ